MMFFKYIIFYMFFKHIILYSAYKTPILLILLYFCLRIIVYSFCTRLRLYHFIIEFAKTVIKNTNSNGQDNKSNNQIIRDINYCSPGKYGKVRTRLIDISGWYRLKIELHSVILGLVTINTYSSKGTEETNS